MKGLLHILAKFNNQILTKELSEKIIGELIRYGIYRPMKVSNEIKQKWSSTYKGEFSEIILVDEDVKYILENNPQSHKEVGFEKGWPSRFATIFDFAKELGFVYFLTNEKIEFSEIGLKLANSINIEILDEFILYSEPNPELEQQAFLHAMANYQRNNPFIRVLNNNVPLILLLEVIQKLDNDDDFNGAGISKLELPLVLYWKNNNANSLYKRIKKLRKQFGYSPSWEVISEICQDEIMQGADIVRDTKSIMVDYPDEFIRKMRLTGLISLRGGGRFIDINRNEEEKVSYILEHYSEYPTFEDEKEYFDYMATTDENLIIETGKKIEVEENDKLLTKWVEHYSWELIKKELQILSNKGKSTDEVLKYLSHPIRLEFLTAIAIKSKLKDVIVIPNYPADDEGIPTSTAGGQGNQGDIECLEDDNGILVEVTMSRGRTQTMMEIWPIERHLKTFSKKNERKSMCHFIAPSIFTDSYKQIKYVKDTAGFNIKASTIDEFVEYLETNKKLYEQN
ncbi:MAG: AlwI family type II restriction endonuclease [Bacteroidales bacterium]|nr:AlwI family type II restriction endonuclease [Bacteroidales bacterium]